MSLVMISHFVSSIKHPKLLSDHYDSRRCVPDVISSANMASHWGSSSSFKTCAANNARFCTADAERGILKPELIVPKHLALIMDGNRRWAKKNGLQARDGHEAGLAKLNETLLLCFGMGVQVVTSYVFSSENWKRSKVEVNSIMELCEEFVARFNSVMQHKIKLSVIGDTSVLPESLQRQIEVTENATRCNKGGHFMMALNYGGRQEIILATKEIANKVRIGLLVVEEIDAEYFEKELQTKHTVFPSPDLLIRTSGEKRLSNFLLWQMAYTELHFVDKMFPDLKEGDIMEAMDSFQRRHRRFGGS